MDELDPKLRSLLDAARDADDPDERDALRVRAAIAATLAQPASRGGERPPGPTSAGGWSAWKWLGAGVAAAGLIAAGSAVQHRLRPSEHEVARPPVAIVAPQRAPEPAPQPSVIAPVATPIPEPALPEPAPPATATPEPARKSHRAGMTRAVPQAQPEPEPAPLTGPSELALIRAATSALRDADGQAAMRLLDQHAQLYPHGILKEERQGLHVLALCALGQTPEALRERERFLSVAPHSPLAGRVQAACGEPKEP